MGEDLETSSEEIEIICRVERDDPLLFAEGVRAKNENNPNTHVTYDSEKGYIANEAA